MIKQIVTYTYVYALFTVLVFCTSCGGQNKTDISKDNSKTETKELPHPRSKDPGIYTEYEYSDSTGKRLVIQNGYPRGGPYIAADGKEYFKTIFWTRLINETFHAIKVTIDFPSDSFKVQSSQGAYRKLLLPPDTMTIDKIPSFDYGLNLKSFLDNNRNKQSSLKRTINPKESTGFYVVSLFIKPKSGLPKARAGFSLKGQSLFYKINGNEIQCGSIDLKNLILKNETSNGI